MNSSRHTLQYCTYSTLFEVAARTAHPHTQRERPRPRERGSGRREEALLAPCLPPSSVRAVFYNTQSRGTIALSRAAHALALAQRTPPARIISSGIALFRAICDAVTFGFTERAISAVAALASRKRPLSSATSAPPSLLIVGLGNPGGAYAATRHNAGKMLVERLAATFGDWRTVDGADLVEGMIGETACVCAAPNSFMNLSGRPVAKLAQRYELPPSAVVVLHDDLDLAAGRVKMKLGGSTGGHNGLGSIAQHLRSTEFYRVRIGIGRPPDRSMVAEYVLEEFNAAELAIQSQLFQRFVELAPDYLPAAVASEGGRSSLLNALQRTGGSASGVRAAADRADDARKKTKQQTGSQPASSSSSNTAAPAAATELSAEAAAAVAAAESLGAPPPYAPAVTGRDPSFGATSLAAGLPDLAVRRQQKDGEVHARRAEVSQGTGTGRSEASGNGSADRDPASDRSPNRKNS